MGSLRDCCKLITAVTFLFFCSYSYSFQNNNAIDIPFVEGEVTIDAHLDESSWQHAKDIDLNLVNFPWNNSPSPIKTTAKIMENGHSLIIGYIAQDPNPERIQKYFSDRDTRWDDDLVGIKLDTQNTRRLSYEFISNPVGIQMDAIQNNITGEKNDLWDGIWYSYGRTTETGYIVEIQIPFRILNFEESQDIKLWAFELFRVYPRDTWLRISHVPLDKNIACKACQYPVAQGFKNADIGHNVMLTPSVVAINQQARDIYDPQNSWQSTTNIEASLDVRWGISSNTLVNSTINPDFSFVEADAAQLNTNETFSLNFAEKRPFFLENNEYFSSNFDLVYTRNIVAPNFGAKLTGTEKNHTYGIFISDDKQTNFILPGNLGSDQAMIDDTSRSAAIKYRYDSTEDISFGFISTLRSSSDYHNYVAGLDSKYQITESNSLFAQILTSNTEYPSNLFEDFCTDISCIEKTRVTCSDNNCPYNEQVLRADKQDDFSDRAYKIDFKHNSEYWDINATHQTIGENFRADLGFMPQTDIKKNLINIDRKFFANEQAVWQEATISTTWQATHNENGELIKKTLQSSAAIDGPYQSFFKFTAIKSDEVGLRFDRSIIDIKGNTETFDLTQFELFSFFKPTEDLYLEFTYMNGDEIDYRDNRLGKLDELESYFSWFATQHLEIEMSHINSQLDADNQNVYEANLIDARISYQFDAHSRLKLSVIYYDIERNLENTMYRANIDKQNKELSTQLLYSYKISPQTVFYLGYSDSSFQDDVLGDLKRENKTFFSKISYAWLP